MARRKRRVKKTAIKYLYLFIFLVVLVVSTALFSKNKITVADKASLNVSGEVYPIKTSKLSIAMVGDCLIHSAVYKDAYSGGKYNFYPKLSSMKPVISKFDLAYYNQESILGGTEIGVSTYPRFNSPQEVGDAMIDTGFNIVSLANNHTLDRGKNAIVNSRKYWNSHKDIMVNGSATSQKEKDDIQIFEKNGIKYTMLSYTTTTNGIPMPNDYYVNWYSEANVKKDIDKVKDKTDVIMVAMHWGVEYNTGVTQEQKNIAKYLASLGVNIVIGAHPHVIEPAEYIDNTLVIYSLGNFISAQRTDEQLSGLLMSADIVKKVDTKTGESTISIENATADFTYTYRNKSTLKGYKVYPYKDLNANIFPNYKKTYNTLKERMTSMDSKIKVKSLEK